MFYITIVITINPLIKMCRLYIIAFDGMTWEDIQIFDNHIAAEQLLEKIKTRCTTQYNKNKFRIEVYSKHNDRFLPTYDSITK